MNQLPDIPAWRQAEITSTDRERGPSVPTILVIAGKKFYSRIVHANIKIMHMKIEQIYAKSQLYTHRLTALGGSKMEAIRMGSSSSSWVEGIFLRPRIFPSEWFNRTQLKKKKKWDRYWFQRVYSFFLLLLITIKFLLLAIITRNG